MATATITPPPTGGLDRPISGLEPRFGFGKNWRSFLSVLTERRIEQAESSLKAMLQLPDLHGRSFLDIGCGSGLSSLAARRLGARVHSFDYDRDSVGCASELRHKFFPGDGEWTIERGDALDEQYIRQLGQFDVVYSWGVLHHTGDMWRALGLATLPVAPEGLLWIAIYNDQGGRSLRWARIKQLYNRLPKSLRTPYVVAVMLPLELRSALAACCQLRFGDYARTWTAYQNQRGMNRWHDLVDWVGGWPFEVAKPEDLFEFFQRRGFILRGLKTRQSLGCNELVMQRSATTARFEVQ